MSTVVCGAGDDGVSQSQCAARGPFIPRYNIKSGSYELLPTSVDYDYHQEIARSAYGDMLHDKDRNERYELAIAKAVKTLLAEGKPVSVLDIGAGTGLLSMMAARHGASQVTACEIFQPMFEIAQETVARNGFDKIKILNKDSVKLQVGAGRDVDAKATLLITEVFDTELIGERALATYRHAVENLTAPGCVCVPHSALVYVQLVECDMIRAWSRLSPTSSHERGWSVDVKVPPDMSTCPGVNCVWDLQIDALTNSGEVKFLTKPVVVKKYVWGDLSTLSLESVSREQVGVVAAGRVDGLLFWWTLDMSGDGQNILSCEPRHVNSDAQWRDHWMHAIYPVTPADQVVCGEEVYVDTHQSEYSYHFEVHHASNTTPSKPSLFNLLQPTCHCTLHVAYSRSRIGEMNDGDRNVKYIASMRKLLQPNDVCIHLGDGSLLPIFAVQLGAKKVYCVERERGSRQCMHALITENGMADKVEVIGKKVEDVTEDDLGGNKIDVILSEPYFYGSDPLWNGLHVAFARDTLASHLSEGCKFLLHQASVKCVGVRLHHLWKIRAPVGEVQGFDMSVFDETIQKSIGIADQAVEPHALWEYECDVLTQVSTVATFNLTDSSSLDSLDDGALCSLVLPSGETRGDVRINAIVLWMEYVLCDGTSISTGLQGSEWSRCNKQGVYFLPAPSHSTLQVKMFKRPSGHPNNNNNYLALDVLVQPLDNT